MGAMTMSRLDAAWDTQPGVIRTQNEDAISGTAPDFEPASRRGYLYIVADGMGGHNAGEVASSQAAQSVYQRYYADADPDIHRSLDNAIRWANAELYQQAQSEVGQHGMGTTLTAAVIAENHLFAAHVGDSRMYLLRGGKLEQVTQDHSWVEEQVQAKVLTRAQAESHPQRNIITRALATEPDVRVDHFDRDLTTGDIVILCSDGLSTDVEEEQLVMLSMQAPSAHDAVQTLIERANANGGRDNVSVAVIRLVGEKAATRRAASRLRLPSVLLAAAIVVVAILLLAVLTLVARQIR